MVPGRLSRGEGRGKTEDIIVPGQMSQREELVMFMDVIPADSVVPINLRNFLLRYVDRIGHCGRLR